MSRPVVLCAVRIEGKDERSNHWVKPNQRDPTFIPRWKAAHMCLQIRIQNTILVIFF